VPAKVFAKRMAALEKETSLEIFAKAKALEAQGKDVIHLEIGEPDFDTPAHIKEAAIAAINQGYTHYGPSAGLPAAREAIARYITRDRGVPVGADQVVVTAGAKSIIYFTMLALIEEGDEVLYPNPGFPNYEMTIRMLGGRDVPVPLIEEKGFSIDLDKFESLVTDRTKLCVINSPHNPTGGMLSRDVLEGILDIAARHDFYILSDEIYSKIVYDGSFESMYSLPGAAERTILLDGHSKTYAMTGWRLGYAVMPKELVPIVTRAAGNVTSCTCSFTQIAGIEALEGPHDDVRAMVEEFRARRDIIVQGLNSLPGVRCHKPAGAFYVFPNIKNTHMSSGEISRLLLDRAGVAVLSGTTFGAHGEGFIRLSYANSRENIKRAIDRIGSALRA
jgi:aspartate/methionine/tyrosine aminotransferase